MILTLSLQVTAILGTEIEGEVIIKHPFLNGQQSLRWGAARGPFLVAFALSGDWLLVAATLMPLSEPRLFSDD